MKRNSSRFTGVSILILLALFTYGCKTAPTEVAPPTDDVTIESQISAESPPGLEFQQTIKGYMAELGQCMDDVYRFWDSNSMHQTSLERLDRMIEIHDECLAIYKPYLETYMDGAYSDQYKAFEEYLIRSKDLTVILKEAIMGGNDDEIMDAFNNLDMNRRNAHTDFG